MPVSSRFSEGVRVFLFLFTLVLMSSSLAHAAGLNLASGGITIKNRTYGSPLTCTLTASSDTYVHAGQPSSSFGSQTTLQVNSSGTSPRRVLVRFDLTACSPAVAPDAIVHSATVRLTTASAASLTARSYDLHRVTSSWSESTTWDGQPSVFGTATSTVTIPGLTLVGTTFQWPAARDVQAFIAADNADLGWRLKDTSESGLGASMNFSSREAGSNRPQLIIIYAP